jgi:hypothetical protein
MSQLRLTHRSRKKIEGICSNVWWNASSLPSRFFLWGFSQVTAAKHFIHGEFQCWDLFWRSASEIRSALREERSVFHWRRGRVAARMKKSKSQHVCFDSLSLNSNIRFARKRQIRPHNKPNLLHPPIMHQRPHKLGHEGGKRLMIIKNGWLYQHAV